MSDEGAQRPTIQDTREGWKARWAGQGMPWRTEPEIADERQRYLAARRTVTPDVEKGLYPFRDETSSIKLARADIEWLLATHESGGMRGPVDWGNESQRGRAGLDLRGATLQGSDLRNLPLDRAIGGLDVDDWYNSIPERRNAAALHLEDVDAEGVYLRGAVLRRAHLEHAVLRRAHLEGADLYRAHLDEATLGNAYLEGAILRGAHLSATNLGAARLHGADLRRARFSAATNLFGASLGDGTHPEALVADAWWQDVNLATVRWTELRMLGDERHARGRNQASGQNSDRRLDRYEVAVRANRQLATAMRNQGLNEDADRFAYRAQALQRNVLWLQGHFLKGAGSLFLDLISGYGYRPLRSFFTYVAVILGFALIYYSMGGNVDPALSPVDALIFSVTSFHGRGFSPGAAVTLHNPLTLAAATEAVLGLLIEITFIATFTQRFFAR